MQIFFPLVFVAMLVLNYFSVDNGNIFARKMEIYYGIPLRFEVVAIPNNWWGATIWNPGGCTDQVWIDDAFLGELGKGHLWKGVLAHEWAHVLQGENCVNNERNANKIAVQKLKDAGEWKAVDRWCEYVVNVEKMNIVECQ